MSAKDVIHDAVKIALIKDGWTITADPFTIRYEDATVFAELAAERPIAAEKAGNKIIVEIKSFSSPSPMHDLKIALGQYQIYLPFLHELDIDHKLYLAISDLTYESLFQRKSVELLVEWYQLPLFVVNIASEEIIEWIN
jgi:hypothetical protein